jgi:hypothetical protein
MSNPAPKSIFDESSDSMVLVVGQSVSVDHVLTFRPAHESSQTRRFFEFESVASETDPLYSMEVH